MQVDDFWGYTILRVGYKLDKFDANILGDHMLQR